MFKDQTPDARCIDCGTSFAAVRPGLGNLLRWRCSSCNGHLLVHIACRNCGEAVDRKTGFRGIYGRLSSPSACEHCGEKVGLANNLPGAFGGPGFFMQGQQRLLSHASLRSRLACVLLIYCMTTGFVGLTIGMMIGGCLSGVLYAAGLGGFETFLGLSPARWSSLIMLAVAAAFGAAGVWYGWRHVDVEISEQKPRPLDAPS